MYKNTLASPNTSSRATGYSIRFPLLAAFILAVVLPVAITSAFSAVTAYDRGRTQALSQLDSVARLKQTQIELWIDDQQTELRTVLTDPDINWVLPVSGFPDLRGDSEIRLRSHMEAFKGETQSFDALFLTDNEGSVRLSTDPALEGTSFSSEANFALAATEDVIIPPLYAAGDAPITFLHPVEGMNGTAIIGGRVSVSRLSDFMTEQAGLGETGETYLIDQNKRLLTQSRFPGYEIGQTLIDNDLTANGVTSEGTGLYSTYRDVEVIGVSKVIDRLNLLLLAEQSQDEVFAVVNQIIASNILITIFAVVVVVVIGLQFTNRQIIQPLQSLSNAAGQVALGSLDVNIPLKRRDEFGLLAETFNSMARRLSDLVNTLEERVTARTRDVQVAADVSRQITQVVDLRVLLPQIVDQTRAAFNLYHVSIFLYLPEKQMLALSAGTGQAGERMIAENKYFYLNNPVGLVPRAGRNRESVIINDVRRAEDYFANPHLPETRSEMALPIVSGSDLLGVLDLQSEQVDRFTDEDLRAMTILADQIAVAIRNAQLFTEAQDALERAEAASKAKSVFLSNMSHELRTPLNMVIGYTSSMLNMPQMYDYQPLPEIFRPDIQLIEENGEYLLGLINDILDLSKIEVGKFEINCAPVDLNAIFEGVMATSIGLLKDKPLQLRPQYPDNLPKVWADNIRIRQVLLNLMSNAIKYSETGTVTLSAKVEGEQIRIAVTDTGIGIPQDALATIFDRFQQIQNNTTIQGTGLGLDISQRLVQLHGSELEVQSSIGQGSTFSFWLPIATPEQLRVEAPAAPQLMESGIKVFTESDWTSLSQRSILVVEDDADVRMLLRQALEGRGNLVIDTNDREQTLDMASGVLPHLIILDVDMKDGWEIMGDLQSNPDTSSIPVLLLAAYESVKRAETSKAAYVLRKPITVGDIQTAVADIFIGSVKQ